MRPFRLILEYGNPTGDTPVLIGSSSPRGSSEPSGAAVVNKGSAWDLLVDARRKLVAAIAEGRSSEVEPINQWIGGGIAILAACTAEDPNSLLGRLKAEVPQPELTPFVSQSGRATFTPVVRERPDAPPGAPKPLDYSTLTPEEREELGIVLADMDGAEGVPSDTAITEGDE